jgi:hypothetical protein
MALLCRFEKLEEYAELNRWLNSLKKAGRTSDWGDAMRDLIENDLFFLVSEVLSDGQHLHSETGKRFYWHQHYVDMCRQVERQIARGGGFDGSGRGSGKSTVRTKGGNIQRMVKYPNSTGCIFSFQRKSSRKHFLGIKEELETNVILRTVCDDIFFWDPKAAAKNGETTWSKEEGLRVKRRAGIVYREHTLEYNAFFDGTPTGGRYDWLDFDDIEDWKALGTEEMLEKLHKTYDASLFVLTAREINPPVIMFTNTFYSDIGLANRVYKRLKEEEEDGVRVSPGENLEIPGDGPMGGTPQYPFTLSSLQRWYRELDDPLEYATQICCSFRAGASRTLSKDWLLFYRERPEVVGRSCNIYICIDPSRGIKDPTVIFVWGLGPDRKFRCLDISMRWLDPALPEYQDEVMRVIARWQGLGKRIVEIRVEQFGQAIFADLIAGFLRSTGYSYPLIKCADNTRTGKFSSGKLDRVFERWAAPARNGDVMFPLPLDEGGQGLVRDVKGKNVDLVRYFIDREWSKFPKPDTDNILDAGGLVWEPDERTKSPLQFPPSTPFRRQQQRYRGSSAMSMG